MSAPVNYTGDDELYSGGSFYPNPMDLGPMDLGRLCTIGSNADVYCPSTKRTCVDAPFNFENVEHEQSQNPSIEILPDECLFEIFRRLASAKERSSGACVSKKWLMLMSSISKDEIKRTTSSDVEVISGNESGEDNEDGDGYLNRRLNGNKATDVRLAAIAVGTNGRGGLGKLSIRGNNAARGVTDHGLSAIARGCPSLRSLSLWKVASIGDEGLSKIAKGCHMLEKLDLSHSSSITNKGLIAIAEGCPNLTTLNIDSCSKIGNEGLQAVARFCPMLESICIKNCPLVGDHGVSSLLSLASELSKVKLGGLNITDFTLAVIGHYGKAIITLVLSRLQNVSERGFWVMGIARGLQNLESLTVSSCRGVTDVTIDAVGRGCSKLKHMYLHKCCFVSDSGLVFFGKGARSLEYLQLKECNRITQSGIIGVLSNINTKLKSLNVVKCTGIKDIDAEVSMLFPCETLQSLTIQNCPGFGSASLGVIAKLCPQLQYLDLTGLYGITDVGFLPFLGYNEAGLVNVNLTGCWNITDNLVKALVKIYGGTLEMLNLNGCWKITDASLTAIADNCLLLNDLDVSKSSITDAGLAVLSNASQLSMQVLSISGCSDVSNKSVPFLTRLGKTLLGLNIQNCNSISSSTVEYLMENLWRCDILA